jgi:hypothetical protein
MAPSSPTAQKEPPAGQSALANLSVGERTVVEAWRDLTGRYPSRAVWPYILERLTQDFDAERLRRCGGAYIANYGRGQKHVAGICDWYSEDRTQPERRSGNGIDGRPERRGGGDHPKAGGRQPSRIDRDRDEYLRQMRDVSFDAAPSALDG